MHKVAFLLTHPIQYFSPFFRELAACPDIDLTVYYCSREGHDVFHDVEFGRSFKWDIPLLEGYRSVFLRNHNPFGGVNRGFTGLINMGLPRELIKGRYDLLFVHGWGYCSSWIALLTAILCRLPFVVRGETPLGQELLKNGWKRALKKTVFGIVFKRMHAAMAIGTQNAGFYRYYGVPDEKIILMPYTVDNAFFMSAANSLRGKKSELRRKHGLPEDKVIINFTGKLTDTKRPFDLLRAYAAANAPDKALIFVGDGNLSGDLRSFAEKENIKNIYFTGFKNQLEIIELYALSDIFVLPSNSETWGLTVNEAMCFSLPVVVSDTVGCGADLVKSGENGCVIKKGDISELTETLGALISSASLRAKMGERSLEIIKNWGFDRDITAMSDMMRAL